LTHIINERLVREASIVLRAMDLHIEFRKSLSKYIKDQKYLIAEVEGGVDV